MSAVCTHCICGTSSQDGMSWRWEAEDVPSDTGNSCTSYPTEGASCCGLTAALAGSVSRVRPGYSSTQPCTSPQLCSVALGRMSRSTACCGVLPRSTLLPHWHTTLGVYAHTAVRGPCRRTWLMVNWRIISRCRRRRSSWTAPTLSSSSGRCLALDRRSGPAAVPVNQATLSARWGSRMPSHARMGSRSWGG